MSTKYLQKKAVLALFGVCLVAATTLSMVGQVPSPESVIGFKVGEDRRLADWTQVLAYFKAVTNAAPDRVRFDEVGKSTLGKPFVALTISSAENMRQLDHYLSIQQKLADPRGLADADAEKLIQEGKSVVLITCTIHSDEVASTQTAMEFVYRLLSEDTPRHRAILDNDIFLLIPSLNPDGQDMVVKWYYKYIGTPFEGSGPIQLYQPYVGHDNNRDWYMFTQVESRLAVEKVQNVWHPQVVYDVHEMGQYGARIFVPPYLDPVDPNIDPRIVSETNMLGTEMAADLATAGKSGVVVNALFDLWTPARHYQDYHAGLRILSESAATRLASPVQISPKELETNEPGYNPQQSSWNYPNPWRGGEWHLRDNVEYQLTSFESCLFHVAQNREMYLRNFYHIGKDAIQPQGAPFAYLVLDEQKDVAAAVKMLNILRFGLVEVQRAKQTFSADGISYPAGTYVILLAQPYGRYAKTLLERQRYPDLREYPGGPPKEPYDATAQTLPLQMGVRTVEVTNPFQAELERLNTIELPHPKPPQLHKRAYLLRADSNVAYLAVNQLLKAGVEVARLKTHDSEGGREFPSGTFLIRSNSLAQVANLGLEFYGSDTGFDDVAPLRLPRIAVYRSYIPISDEGWTRWLLEQYGFPYSTVHDNDIRAGKLHSRFDVIVIPDESTGGIVNGHPSKELAQERVPLRQEHRDELVPELDDFQGPVPPEYTGGIGESGVANLRAFVMEGGTLVTLNRASDFAIERIKVGVQNVLQNVPNRDFYCPGSILRIDVDTDHPLGYGMDKESAAWGESS